MTVDYSGEGGLPLIITDTQERSRFLRLIRWFQDRLRKRIAVIRR